MGEQTDQVVPRYTSDDRGATPGGGKKKKIQISHFREDIFYI